jgi:hypothetical protein
MMKSHPNFDSINFILMPSAHENPMSVSDCPVENTLQIIDEFESLFPKGLDRSFVLTDAPE